jgi:hypothetical protein
LLNFAFGCPFCPFCCHPRRGSAVAVVVACFLVILSEEKAPLALTVP